MNEQLEVQAARLQTVGGRLVVSELPDPGVASESEAGNWGALYAVSHVVTEGPGMERIRDRIEGVAEETYRRSPGGVTNRLRQAVRNANRYMYLRNRVRGERQALFAALGCAVVRGTDAYACGVGPHSVFVLSQGRVRGHVNHISRSSRAGEETWKQNGHGLGHSATLADPKFSYRQIAPGDLLVIVTGDGAELVEQRVYELAGLLDSCGVQAGARQLGDLLGAEMKGSALLLRLGGPSALAMNGPTSTPKRVSESRISASRVFARAWGQTREMKEEQDRVAPPLEREDYPGLDIPGVDAPLARQPSARWSTVDSYPRGDSSRTRAGVPRGQAVERGVEAARMRGTVLISLLMGLAAGGLGLLRSSVGMVKRGWGWIRRNRVMERVVRGIGLAIMAVVAGVKGLVVGILPERQGASRTYAASARPMARAKVLVFHPSGRTRALIGVVLLLGAAVLVGTSLLSIKGRLAQAEVEELATEVEGLLIQADGEEDTEARMALLTEAQGLLDQPAEGQVDSAALDELSREVALRWDGLTGVVRLPLMQEAVWPTPEQSARRLLVHDDYAYVVDEAGACVYQYALDDTGRVVTDKEPSKWELTGPGGELSADRIVDFEWVEASNGRLTPALLILTTDGSVLELGTDGSLRSVAVSQLLPWEDTQALGTYSGNLYVLDPGHENIIKYVPDGDDYDHDPVDYVQAASDVPWPKVMDMAIDGFIYLLLSDGSVMKFAGGQAQAFPQEGLYPPLEEPLGISASPDSSSVFVADSLEGRIVEFTQDGQFVRQYRASLDGEDHLGAMTAFAVDTGHSRVLIATASGLYSATLPSLQ
jgi:hypothetical protein